MEALNAELVYDVFYSMNIKNDSCMFNLIRGIILHFGNFAYLLSWQAIDENIESTHILVPRGDTRSPADGKLEQTYSQDPIYVQK